MLLALQGIPAPLTFCRSNLRSVRAALSQGSGKERGGTQILLPAVGLLPVHNLAKLRGGKMPV